MFTDEIGLLGDIPWSPQLPAYFKERCGYDLLEHLYALINPEPAEGVKIRYDYYQSVHLLLRESYHQQVHDWCERGMGCNTYLKYRLFGIPLNYSVIFRLATALMRSLAGHWTGF
jgi:hypothetical protein